jgi:hypothetical protein
MRSQKDSQSRQGSNSKPAAEKSKKKAPKKQGKKVITPRKAHTGKVKKVAPPVATPKTDSEYSESETESKKKAPKKQGKKAITPRKALTGKGKKVAPPVAALATRQKTDSETETDDLFDDEDGVQQKQDSDDDDKEDKKKKQKQDSDDDDKEDKKKKQKQDSDDDDKEDKKKKQKQDSDDDDKEAKKKKLLFEHTSTRDMTYYDQFIKTLPPKEFKKVNLLCCPNPSCSWFKAIPFDEGMLDGIVSNQFRFVETTQSKASKKLRASNTLKRWSTHIDKCFGDRTKILNVDGEQFGPKKQSVVRGASKGVIRPGKSLTLYAVLI